MKAITICQPYAHLIVRGEKRVENRPWSTRYRGPIAIHAGLSRKWLRPGDEECCPEMAFGAIVGLAELVSCLTIQQIRTGRGPSWLRDHEHAVGPYCLVLDTVRPLGHVVPCRGNQRIFELPVDVMDLVSQYDTQDCVGWRDLTGLQRPSSPSRPLCPSLETTP